VPKAFVVENGRLVGMTFEIVRAEYDDNGRRGWCPPASPTLLPCDDVLVAVGQENAFPWIERDIGLEFDPRWDMPKVDPVTMQSTLPNVFFGGDAAFGPKNIIWAVAHGHEAAISIDKHLDGEDVRRAPRAGGRHRQPEDGHPRMEL
jgi:formate dehydrogenase (NADP+) beta subunit